MESGDLDGVAVDRKETNFAGEDCKEAKEKKNEADESRRRRKAAQPNEKEQQMDQGAWNKKEKSKTQVRKMR